LADLRERRETLRQQLIGYKNVRFTPPIRYEAEIVVRELRTADESIRTLNTHIHIVDTTVRKLKDSFTSAMTSEAVSSVSRALVHVIPADETKRLDAVAASIAHRSQLSTEIMEQYSMMMQATAEQKAAKGEAEDSIHDVDPSLSLDAYGRNGLSAEELSQIIRDEMGGPAEEGEFINVDQDPGDLDLRLPLFLDRHME